MSVSGRPVIGICAAVERVSWGAWRDVPSSIMPLSYSRAVQAGGAVALLLPPDDEAAQRPDELLDLIDGLMLAGGCDVDPASYGATPHPETSGTWPERDRFELALTHRAVGRAQTAAHYTESGTTPNSPGRSVCAQKARGAAD